MFDYIDFGTSKGSSQLFLREQVGSSGVGIDYDTEKVSLCKESGLQAIAADIKNVPFADKCCKVVGIVHVLEHLSGYEEALLVVKEAIRVATTLVYIVVPYFDADASLQKRGLYLEWSRYVGHTYHITSQDFHNLSLSLNKKMTISKKHPIFSTCYPAIKGDRKGEEIMLKNIYRELEVLVWLS